MQISHTPVSQHQEALLLLCLQLRLWLFFNPAVWGFTHTHRSRALQHCGRGLGWQGDFVFRGGGSVRGVCDMLI